jgi:transcriptional antiterminator Rof (Rho-off)
VRRIRRFCLNHFYFLNEIKQGHLLKSKGKDKELRKRKQSFLEAGEE